MASVPANGITIEYETSGDPGQPPLLLIMGLGGQLIAWDPDFVAALVARGFYVVRFDNRDAGRTTWFDDLGVPDMAAALAGEAQPPYLLSDMANDAAALLDALDVPSAHVLGLSMGGMIAQTLAIQYPWRVRTLTSVMSTTGDWSVGQAHQEALELLSLPPAGTQQEAVATSLQAARVLGSPGFAFPEDRLAARAFAAYDRGFHPSGAARQLTAILSSPDRTPGLRGLQIPTLVIHGDSDRLVDPSGGEATAAAVPGAILWMIPGMGHDLPPELFWDIADRVATHCGM
jgi:pimeloyl-ACP methyl ester carboxylesterase